ncbi:chromosome segregation protein Spc105, putative [Talaromyces stipitatus ATCC 10500]|uniref:Chromosome segregation protein Spc105, putative n=1 Tax=Talaromyces stipitatus (strain ATCC 10500 / CBS 375.48 / QM 6759 / NRRL 1006) TaxID=441959 RepID=B8MGZ6_TALSN|nr:chromosome segregation protein Spc105, putative [Talaromyces stipitatus ATCC 10500]EED16377.1 chromosome segregation protein Spc105, putative [Talaromyces stipitatus ATCC 10500]
MATRDKAGTVRPRSRRSIAYVPKTGSTPDQENATTDIGAMKGFTGEGRGATRDKKSRSKSLGPGGLDALQSLSGNRRKSTMAIPLKSILKPTIPVSPLRTIPTFDEARRQRDTANKSQADEGLLIDFSTPAKPPVTGTEQLDNPFDGFNVSSAIRDAKEREERERKEREKKAILEQREARRKSMASRRVSFAPEATLHTWNVVELAEDSTSSSAANSTRRTSSLANSRNQAPTEPQEFKAEDEEDPDAIFSPIQPSLHQQPHELSSSPFSGSSVGGSDGTQSPVKDVDDADSDSEDFDAESTAMSLDDITSRTSGTAPMDDNTSSSERLNEALRQAAREAGTRGIDLEDDNDVSMEIADQEITGAFKPWIQKGQRISFDMEDMSALQDQENINPFSQSPRYDHAGSSDSAEDDYNENEELSMEITNAVGKILSNSQVSRGPRKSISEQTNYDEQTMELTKVVGGIEGQQSPDAESNMEENEEMTMEFTSVIGGVLSKHVPSTVRPIGGRVADAQGQEDTSRDFSEWGSGDEDEDAGMDMEFTGAVGGILSPIMEERTGSQDGHTAGMDITAAVGRILSPGLATSDRNQAKELMELESESGQLLSSPFQVQVPPSPAKPLPSHHIAPIASETGSPSLASVRSRRSRRGSGSPAIHLSPSRQLTPSKKPRTPSKQATPQPPRPTTPGKTPPSSNISLRSASPKKLFREEIKASASKSQSPGRRSLFEASANGDSTPVFILRPHPRQSSGLGIDKEGLGSPKVAEILDRRRSIGEDAQEFVPQEPSPRRLRFEDPIKIHEEVDREREEEENREERISVLQASDLDPTTNLRDLISSLTPKKRKVGTRKSLHVGAARGLLGKRPAELDEDEEDESPKRIRAANASPVKPVKLPAPPSKDETVRHVTRGSMGKSSDLSPVKQGTFTPRGQPLARIESPLKLKSPSQALYRSNDEGTQEQQIEAEPVVYEAQDAPEEDLEWEPIQLQDFLNLTNIHFMELTTTKRRHTTVAGNDRMTDFRGTRQTDKRVVSLEDCVAAGFCTVPMLELYQHSCRELKSYISEGRQIIHSIEEETFADNPPLFREYVTARPDIRLLMDNQFRNVKTHARLLSKAMWYEWRMKLLEGLKEGLDRHVEEMQADDALLSQQEAILQSVVPGLVEKRSLLDSEASRIQEIVDEMENIDPNELRMARERLAKVDTEIERKKKQLEQMQEDLQNKNDTIEAGAELKAEFLKQIREAERVQEECRGWSIKEVNALKDSVHALEIQTGWSIVSAIDGQEPTGPGMTLRYKGELEVKVYPKLFKSATETKEDKSFASFELAYNSQHKGQSHTLAHAKSFIFSHLCTAVRTIPSSTPLKQVFRFLTDAWDLTYRFEEETRFLNFHGVTKTAVTDAADVGVTSRARCILIGMVDSGEGPKQARIDVDFRLTPRVNDVKEDSSNTVVEKLQLYTDVAVSKVYGFPKEGTRKKILSDAQMRDVILRKLRGHKGKGADVTSGLMVNLGQGSWGRSVQELALKVFS